MIAVDTNVLIYANRAEMPLHDVARERLAELAEGSEPWALPCVVAWGFLRIVTQSIFDPPTPMGQAVEFIDHLLASPTVRVLTPGAQHWQLLAQTIDDAQVRGGLVTDAVIVALCREFGITKILSNDRDFARFSDIDIERLA